MGLFDIFKDPESIINDSTMLRIQLWTGKESDNTYQVDLTKRQLMDNLESYKANGLFIMAVWDTTWRQNFLHELSEKMDKITGFSEYEKRHEKNLDLVFYDGPEGSFSFTEHDCDILDGELRALDSSNNRRLDDYNIECVYHITHYDNVGNILRHGILPHDNKYVNIKIDNEDVNRIREKKDPINNKRIHSYVPFYFNPKNAMLYVNKDKQDDIVILEVDRRVILKEGSLFSDGNAASKDTIFYSEVDDLSMLDWDVINYGSWTDYEDGKRQRMSEVLVQGYVKSELIQKIYCYDLATVEEIKFLDPHCEVEIEKSFYF